MSLVFRPCRAEDVDAVIPLMYSAGPEAYRYTFSVSSELQVLDFLRIAFVQGAGEFGYRDHFVALDGKEIVALVGMRSADDSSEYLMAVVKNIFGFYGPINGLRVIIRGLRFEKIVAPPKKRVISLHNLAVTENCRGKGYGRQVIAWFLQQADKKNALAVGLDVAETNPRAKALYRELGFEVKRAIEGKLSNKYGRGVGHEYMEYSLLS